MTDTLRGNSVLPRLRHMILLALTCGIFVAGCSHSQHNASLPGSAPNIQKDDTRRAKAAPNPNAPYMVATNSKPPQLVKRADEAGGTEPCQDKNLTVTEIAATVNGNYRAVKLAFYNQGLAPCRIGGFPNVSLLDQHGNPAASLIVDHISEAALRAKLEPGAVENTSAAPVQAQLVIAPRGEAWFQMGWSTGDTCPAVSRISVSAPGSSEAFTVNHPLNVCEGRIEITSLRGDS